VLNYSTTLRTIQTICCTSSFEHSLWRPSYSTSEFRHRTDDRQLYQHIKDIWLIGTLLHDCYTKTYTNLSCIYTLYYVNHFISQFHLRFVGCQKDCEWMNEWMNECVIHNKDLIGGGSQLNVALHVNLLSTLLSQMSGQRYQQFDDDDKLVDSFPEAVVRFGSLVDSISEGGQRESNGATSANFSVNTTTASDQTVNILGILVYLPLPYS